MILEALYELCEREQLMGDPVHEVKPVTYLIRLDKAGQLLGIESTEITEAPPPGSRRKPRSYPRSYPVPREPGRTRGDYAFFLVDKAEYVFGIDPAEKRDSKKLATRFRLFKKKVDACVTATGDAGVGAVGRFLDDLARGTITVDLPEDCVPNALFAFLYAPDVDALVHERAAVRDYWKAMRAEEVSSTANAVRCLVTGKRCEPVDKHDRIMKVPGGSSSGVALISFNKNAFESYGLIGAANAPISRHASEAIATALNRLVHSAPPDPADTKRRLPRRNLRLSADTIACYWTRQPCTFLDWLNPILEGDGRALEAPETPEAIRKLYLSLRAGSPFQVNDPGAFYSLVLSGAQGRATLRDWIQTDTQAVLDSLARYFKELQNVRRHPPSKGKTHPPTYPISELLEAVVAPQESRKEGVPAHLAAGLYRAALTGEQFPHPLLTRAVARYRTEIANEHNGGADGWRTRQWNDARAALIRAFINRRNRQLSTQAEEVPAIMNPACTVEGYVLGQLMAVLARLHQVALNNISTSRVERCFSAASAAPRSIFISLLKNARHHARKGMDDKKHAGMVFRLERLVDELANRFVVPNGHFRASLASPASNGFPANLDQQQQGLFIIGYHQMRKWLCMTKEERAAWETEHPNAPGAYRWDTAADTSQRANSL